MRRLAFSPRRREIYAGYWALTLLVAAAGPALAHSETDRDRADLTSAVPATDEPQEPPSPRPPGR